MNPFPRRKPRPPPVKKPEVTNDPIKSAYAKLEAALRKIKKNG